ncbi:MULTISPECIES: hypothetical protein [Streptomyces]|uniref:Uncharacterized protein n=1 Tax=Streptomyces griseosporeus TaxID=1910 RepID=A0ABV3KWD2_STRGS|nr:hypothetical protein [Streptomyces actuosus]MBM4824019.1 hypothetical protein [Streptomyces actuosus]
MFTESIAHRDHSNSPFRPHSSSTSRSSTVRKRADLVVRAPAAWVPVMLLEVDRRTEDAHDLVAMLRRYWEDRLLPKDADQHTVVLVPSRPDAIDQQVDGGVGRPNEPLPKKQAQPVG